MGRSGPAPTPTNLVLLRGNPGKRKVNRNEPKPQGVASRPQWLSADAKAEWDRVAPELKRLGLLTKIDQSAFACYCEAVGDLKWATKKLTVEPRVIVTGKNGYPMPHPAIAIRRQAMELIKKFTQEFGLTPSGRTRLEVPDQKPKDKDAFQEYLHGRKPKKS